MGQFRIIVADSARARLFDADPKTRTIAEIGALVHPESREKDLDLTTDKGGRTFDSAGEGRHAMSPHTSAHKLEADVFARELADHLHDDVRDCIDKTLDKNLVHETPAEIAKQFFARER